MTRVTGVRIPQPEPRPCSQAAKARSCNLRIACSTHARCSRFCGVATRLWQPVRQLLAREGRPPRRLSSSTPEHRAYCAPEAAPEPHQFPKLESAGSSPAGVTTPSARRRRGSPKADDRVRLPAESLRSRITAGSGRRPFTSALGFDPRLDYDRRQLLTEGEASTVLAALPKSVSPSDGSGSSPTPSTTEGQPERVPSAVC